MTSFTAHIPPVVLRGNALCGFPPVGHTGHPFIVGIFAVDHNRRLSLAQKFCDASGFGNGVHSDHLTSLTKKAPGRASLKFRKTSALSLHVHSHAEGSSPCETVCSGFRKSEATK